MRLPHSRRSMKPGLDPLSSSLATCRVARVAPCSRNGLWTNYHKKDRRLEPHVRFDLPTHGRMFVHAHESEEEKKVV